MKTFNMKDGDSMELHNLVCPKPMHFTYDNPLPGEEKFEIFVNTEYAHLLTPKALKHERNPFLRLYWWLYRKLHAAG